MHLRNETMSGANQPVERDQSEVYQIKVRGRLDESWSQWFDGMTITFESGVTTLMGPIVDQPALHGILVKIRDLNLRLISVTKIESEQDDLDAYEGGAWDGKTVETGMA
jgi:hypothetical protein